MEEVRRQSRVFFDDFEVDADNTSTSEEEGAAIEGEGTRVG